jgi:hypothetical protein
MSDSLLSLYDEKKELPQEQPMPYAHLLTREQIIKEIIAQPRYDVVVIGGGISNLLVARDAALQGARVVVIEPGYFGQRAVAWGPQFMRALYTRPGDLVRSALRFRSFSRSVAPQLLRSVSASAPRPLATIQRVATWFFSRCAPATLRWGVPNLNERLLVRELALAARQEGALVLASAEAVFVERNADDGGLRIGVADRLSGDTCEITARALIVDPGFVAPLASRLGTQLFRAPSAEKSALTIVLKGAGEESFEMISLRSGDVIGTVSSVGPNIIEVVLFFDAETPSAGEISTVVEQLCEVARFHPEGEVARWWCGHRYGAAAAIAERRGAMVSEQRVPWDCVNLAHEITTRALSYVDSVDGVAERHERELPGDEYGREQADFSALAAEAGIAADTISRVIERWRGRVRYLDRYEGWSEEVCPGVLKGEVALAVASDHITSLEDLVFGSLALHYTATWRESLAPLASELSRLGVLPEKCLNRERASAAMEAR